MSYNFSGYWVRCAEADFQRLRRLAPHAWQTGAWVRCGFGAQYRNIGDDRDREFALLAKEFGETIGICCSTISLALLYARADATGLRRRLWCLDAKWSNVAGVPDPWEAALFPTRDGVRVPSVAVETFVHAIAENYGFKLFSPNDARFTGERIPT